MTEPHDIFDPGHYQKIRRPFDVAETLPPWCYTSQRFYDRERENIFFRHWNCIGHHSRVPDAGSFVTVDLCGAKLIVVRGQDMQIRAFVNSCSHRGSEIVEGEGTCRVLKCPYHAWAFSLTGELVATPLFEESETFQKADHGLKQVKLELWAGLMWINLDPDSPDLMAHLGDLPERTRLWNADDMVCVMRRSFPMAANWKFFVENFSDGYHVPFVHQKTLNFKKVAKRDFHDPAIHRGNYLMHYTYFDGTRGVRDHQKKLPELELPSEMKQGTFFPVVHANMMMSFAIDMINTMEIYPHGPDSSTLVATSMVPRATAELPDFSEIFAVYQANGDVVRNEDILAAERQQKGVLAGFTRPGCFTPQDRLVHDYDLWILDQVL